MNLFMYPKRNWSLYIFVDWTSFFQKTYKQSFAVYLMKKLVGYIVSIIGILVMALGFGMISLDLEILETISPNYIVGAGIAGIIVGVVISLTDSEKPSRKKGKSGVDEVPIYEGVGKKRKVVGYRKD